jgi:hypothetical protein
MSVFAGNNPTPLLVLIEDMGLLLSMIGGIYVKGKNCGSIDFRSQNLNEISNKFSDP